jgi:hypothetical protein
VKSGKAAYDVFNENNWNILGTYKFKLTENISNNIGYIFNSIKYPYLSELSYSEHILNYNANISFETKTSDIIEINLGLKNYSESFYGITDQAVNANSHSSGGFLYNTGTGYGKWNGKGSGPGMNQNLTSQILLTNRIAQSISDNAGMQLTYSYRYNLLKNSRSSFLGSSFVSDDALFDDHYGYGGHELDLGLTQILPYGILMKANAEYQKKNYYNQFNTSFDENSVLSDRNDNKYIVSFSLQRKFKISENTIGPMDVNLGYSFQKNNSSINLFNYKANILFLGISTTLNF